MHGMGGNLHFILKMVFYCEKSKNKVLHAVTFMVSASIIFQFWQHFDAAVGMCVDAAPAECHAVHKIGTHLANKTELDIKVPRLKNNTQ